MSIPTYYLSDIQPIRLHSLSNMQENLDNRTSAFHVAVLIFLLIL